MDLLPRGIVSVFTGQNTALILLGAFQHFSAKTFRYILQTVFENKTSGKYIMLPNTLLRSLASTVNATDNNNLFDCVPTERTNIPLSSWG